MGRARSRSTDKDGDAASTEAYDGEQDPNNNNSNKRSSNKSSNFLARWKKFGAPNEWANGCGDVDPDQEGSDELFDTQGPPILTIEVDPSKEIDLSARTRPRTIEQITNEFALAAREAVREQMRGLENTNLEKFECSEDDCASSMTNSDPDKSTRSGSAQFDQSARSMPPATMKPTSLLDSFGAARIQEIIMPKTGEPELGQKVMARELAFRHSGKNGCLVFVIRRPGCLLCREQALYLKFLFQNYPNEVEGFTMVGVVKEFCDNGGAKLREFHDRYFPFPLYLDVDRAAYRALGNRKAGLGAALSLLNPFSDTAKRIRKIQISGDLSGEGFLQGGIIIYHRHGMAAYKYEEETGLELPVADIVKGMRSVRRDDFAQPIPESKPSVKPAKSHRHNNKFDMSIRTVF